MQRKQDGLLPIGEIFSGLGGPVKDLRAARPPALCAHRSLNGLVPA